MNIDGNDGPTLKKIFTCEGCKWLVANVFSLSIPFQCYNNDRQTKNRFAIGRDKITPSFCPLLLKKERKEKLIQISENS